MPDHRCPWAIRFGAIVTRCYYVHDHVDDQHMGKGLEDYPYQRISWLRGDSREFETDRVEDYAWEVE